MKKFLFFILLIPFVFGCKNVKEEEKTCPGYLLEPVAQTTADLKTPESVLYCPKGDFLFVSNINGQPLEKDNNGFISKIDTNGNIIELKWVEGLNAPKGMGIANGKLFVTDIDQLVIIDIDSAKIIETIPIENAKFLNDIAIDNNNNVYITDSNNDLIYKYNQDSVVVFAQGLKGANGLYIDQDSLLYVGCSDRLALINLNNAQVETVVEVNSKMIDGLKRVCFRKLKFVTTDWYGTTYLLNITDNQIDTLLYFADEKKNTADVEFIAKNRLVFVPTFFSNTVEIYKLKHKGGGEHEHDHEHEHEHEH